MTIDESSGGKISGNGIADSWLTTCSSLMGSRAHKPSFVVFELGQSGCITLARWFRDRKDITFQADILSQPVRFPRMSVYQRIRQSYGEVYGFSLSVEQLRRVQNIPDPNQFLQDLCRGGCRVVYLQRRDVLRHAIATLRANNIQYPFDPSEPSRSSKAINKVTVDVQELFDCLRYTDNQRIEAQAILHGIPYLELVYEDDLMNPNTYAATAERLTNFLEIPAIQPVGSPLKLVHQRLADIVTNYDEVRQAIEASDYTYLLSDSRHLLSTPPV
ncbi:MAG: hypothetical protein WA949_02035 [Phormidesmis sp.]